MATTHTDIMDTTVEESPQEAFPADIITTITAAVFTLAVTTVAVGFMEVSTDLRSA